MGDLSWFEASACSPSIAAVAVSVTVAAISVTVAAMSVTVAVSVVNVGAVVMSVVASFVVNDDDLGSAVVVSVVLGVGTGRDGDVGIDIDGGSAESNAASKNSRLEHFNFCYCERPELKFLSANL